MTNSTALQMYISIITSVVAIGISSLTLGWTIYRDAIRKPKMRITVGVKRLVQKDRNPEGPYLFIEALNMGPIPNRVGLTFARKSWIKRRILDRETGIAMIYPDFAHWAATKASTRLEVGDSANFIFPYRQGIFLNDDFSQVGVADGFGQVHWSKRSDFRSVQHKYQTDFAANEETESNVVEAPVKENDTVSAASKSAPQGSQRHYHSYKG